MRGRVPFNGTIRPNFGATCDQQTHDLILAWAKQASGARKVSRGQILDRMAAHCVRTGFVPSVFNSNQNPKP